MKCSQGYFIAPPPNVGYCDDNLATWHKSLNSEAVLIHAVDKILSHRRRPLKHKVMLTGSMYLQSKATSSAA